MPPQSRRRSFSWESTNTANRRTSRFMSYDLPSAALAFSASADFERTVICGRDYFKIFRVTPTGLSDPSNIRLPQARKIQFPTEVKWGSGDMMVAALGNGTIALFKDGKVERTWMEHHRQVHKLAFNPLDPKCFLSASSDGSIKLWDTRDKRSRKTFNGAADAVRDVQFNAGSGTEFLAGFDNGTLMVCGPLL
jgi:WD repeat-containing protein 24